MHREKQIVVTGGAGFIGSSVIQTLNEQGRDNIVVVDRLGKEEKWKNLVGKRFFHILEADDLFSWLEGKEKEIGAFIHLGACSDTMETDAAFLLQNNYAFSIQVAEYALRNDHRFVYASSAATYGDGSLGFSDEHALIDCLQPLNMYGYSKQLFDQWLLRHNFLDRVVGLKYFNIFGPNEQHKGHMASALLKMFPIVQKGEPISLFKSSEPERFADGEQKRDFLYGKDAARMTLAFLDGEATGIYNIGSGIATTWNALAEALFVALQKPVAISYREMPEQLHGKYQNYTRAEMGKAQRVLGDQAIPTPFADAVCDYVQNYLLTEKKW